MDSSQWKSIIGKLGSSLKFFGMYIVASLASTLIAFVVLYLSIIGPNAPDLAIITPLVVSPLIGITLASVVMYFYERKSQDRDL